MIPRDIFLYWEGERPPIVCYCVKQLITLNPGFHVYQYDDKNILDVVPPAPKSFKTPQSKSDWYRVWLLYLYGGVWIDASCLTFKPLETWLDMGSDKLICFSDKSFFNSPLVINNWFLASPKGLPFMKRLINELNIYDKNPQNYIENFDYSISDTLHFNRKYLFVYTAFLKANPTPLEVTIIDSSNDIRKGSYTYSDHFYPSKWIGLHEFDYPTISHKEKRPFIKITGRERKYFENVFRKEIEECGCGKSEYVMNHGYVIVILILIIIFLVSNRT